MQLPSQQMASYAAGECFNEQLTLEFAASRDNLSPDRWDYLIKAASGKRVVHIGCLDHESLIDGKIANDRWLHAALTSAASECVGIDIRADLIERVGLKHGFKNIIHHDIYSSSIHQQLCRQWDLVVLPDVLEHIENPVQFLRHLKTAFGQFPCPLIITVPNAFCIDNIKNSMQGTERINSDHYAWYSPYTLCKGVVASGWKVRELHFLEYNRRPKITGIRTLLRNIALKRVPSWRDTIALVCDTL